jgi:hypothetical protein
MSLLYSGSVSNEGDVCVYHELVLSVRSIIGGTRHKGKSGCG